MPPSSKRRSCPLVSIITPSYNQADFIRRTILSVQEQDYPHIEHIVIDGGSTDGTVEILKKYPHLRWVSEKDEGQSDAINKGFKIARGSIVAWLNSDDYYLPGGVEKALQSLQSNPAAGMVYANYLEVDEEGSELRRIKPPAFDLSLEIDGGNIIPQPTVFIRKKVLDDVGFVNPEYHYAMDYDLWIRIGLKYPIVYVDDYWAAFRVHGSSKTVDQASKFWREEREISRKYGSRFFSDHLLNYYSRRLHLPPGVLSKVRRAFGYVRRGQWQTFLKKVKKNLSPRGKG